MNLNISSKKTRQQAQRIASLFRALGQASRLRILLAIGDGEACVCHLEAHLGYRQAYISQQLMELRKAGIVDARREGRFIFYRLRDTALLQLIREAGRYNGVPDAQLDILAQGVANPQCSCPHCTGEPISALIAEEQIL
jgi:DNA-binding transcriptional ArsR family regulator